MADREDIIERINLYGLAMDTRRWDWFDQIFTAECDADYGPSSHWTTREEFKRDFGSFHALFDATQHVMTNHVVAVHGDHAASMTYGAWRLIRSAAGDPPVWDGTGYYDDTWLRTPEGWRIVRRTCRVVYWQGNPKVQTPDDAVSFQLELVQPWLEAREGRLGIVRALV